MYGCVLITGAPRYYAYLDVDEVFRFVDGVNPGVHDGVLQWYTSRPFGARSQHLQQIEIIIGARECIYKDVNTRVHV